MLQGVQWFNGFVMEILADGHLWVHFEDGGTAWVEEDHQWKAGHTNSEGVPLENMGSTRLLHGVIETPEEAK